MRSALPSSSSCGESSAKLLIGDQSGEPVGMCDRIAQRDQAAEADAAEEDRAVDRAARSAGKRCDLIVLADEEARLVGGALAEQIEGRNAKPPARPARRGRRPTARHIASAR